MESITKNIPPERISTSGHENEKDDTKVHDLINNGLSSSIEKANKAIIKKYTNLDYVGKLIFSFL